MANILDNIKSQAKIGFDAVKNTPKFWGFKDADLLSNTSNTAKPLELRYKNESADISGRKARMNYDMFSAEHMAYMRDELETSVRDDSVKMSNAFPTFKLFIIEEDSSQWLNFDDFYGYNSVKSISIHKSRENAADTAVVEITNFRGILDNTDFLAKTHADSAQETLNPKAERENQPIDKMMLRPGTRVRIKLGYNSQVTFLDNTFTGKITSIEYGDIITFVAQGYGIELLEEIGVSLWENIARATWLGPKQIINSLLKRKAIKHFGRWGFNYAQNASDRGWRFDDNPADDNVFVAEGDNWLNYTKWVRQFKLYHENSWEAIQDITRRMPGYVASVVPFDDRATLFFGLPDQKYFYTAFSDSSERDQYHSVSDPQTRLFTLRTGKYSAQPGEEEINVKMFRNYHFKESSHHIISNNIKIDMDNFFNRITVKWYHDNGAAYKNKGYRTLMADDTLDELYWKTKVVYEENCRSADQALNYAMGHLILNAQKLYDGELILLGDPSIKPHDIVFIYDDYTKMYGPIGVREVVHNFDRDGGFTTTVVPDLVIHVNNPFKILQTISAGMLLSSFAAASLALTSNSPLMGAAQSRIPIISGQAFPTIYGRLGWAEGKREPIGVTPLTYNGKPYIAGFEGMKHEDWMTRFVDRWKKSLGRIQRGLREAYWGGQAVLRNSSKQ